ncbi:MAG: sulfatase [Alphaproteobacteria bacterium]
MKVVFVLYDSLNRRSLEPYGAATIRTPNFRRLAERAVTFDSHYVGSLPCMPARRDMQTGRLSFLHRSWGPLEPFDNSFPELLHVAGIYSHLVSDHYHYWEDGGATYHNRYTTYEFIRGQERDPWKAMVEPPWERLREMYHPLQFNEERRSLHYHHVVNREFIREEADFPSVRCFDGGLDFLERNRHARDWLLQIETFDPHEPFHAPAAYRAEYPTNYAGPILDWPPYKRVTEAPDECAELRANYCAIVALCDAQLGRLLDCFDAYGLWSDTALLLTTDHGFLLGEHDWWGKCRMPCFNEVSHIPLFFHHPDYASRAGERRRSLTQTTDVMATLLDLFGVEAPPEVEGRSLVRVLERDEPIREAALYGVWGSATNITDGRYTYFRYPDDVRRQEIYQYTLMATHLKELFGVEELRTASLAKPFAFTKGVPVLKVRGTEKSPMFDTNLGPGRLAGTETALFDLETDPDQLTPIRDADVEARLIRQMVTLMRENDAPAEAYTRLDLAVPA